MIYVSLHLYWTFSLEVKDGVFFWHYLIIALTHSFEGYENAESLK